ncbi:hypothetical protein KAV67_00820, partial [Candidatus Bipolaricaulota bacterium]|nr:hypothetical protein [Candidatus Bipolaricaulota bacterium]
DGQPSLFRITTPELAPAIFYMFSSVVVSEFFDEEGFKAFRINPRKLGERIRYFISGASAGVRMYREKGLGQAIRAGYDHFGLSILDLQDFIDDYDLLTKQIAFHEVAHAYIGQFMRKQRPTGTEQQAFELIADLVATRWFYNVMVRNTPNTDEYRGFRGMDTYADTILANAVMTTRLQLANLMLSAIAGAQCTKGTLSLAASQTHPPGLQRHDLQHLFLLTLIASDFSDILSEEGLSAVQQDWNEKMDVLACSGMLPLEAVKLMLDPSQCEVLEVAADLIEELHIPELMRIIEDLRVTRENLSEFLKFRKIQP